MKVPLLDTFADGPARCATSTSISLPLSPHGRGRWFAEINPHWAVWRELSLLAPGGALKHGGSLDCHQPFGVDEARYLLDGVDRPYVREELAG